MLDCGFGLRETERRLQRLGKAASDIAAILVTHEHQDHVGGVFKFARRHQIPVWLSYGTWSAVQRHSRDVNVRFCSDGQAFQIGALSIEPYTVPHDAREPVQFVAQCEGRRLGVLTDAGHSTPHLVKVLGGCNALVLECNHDRQMLADSAYPPSLKYRIGGPFGHLSNDTTAEILSRLDRSQLKKVIAAHLSETNNTPGLAFDALKEVVGDESIDILVACQHEGFDWVTT